MRPAADLEDDGPRHHGSAPSTGGRRRGLLIAVGAVVLVLVAAGVVVTVAGRGSPDSRSTAERSGTATSSAHAASTSTLAGSSSAIRAENAKPGSSDWHVPATPAVWDKVRGFTDKVSAQHGETVAVYATTAAPTFHVEAWRMGFYGGAQGRLVWRSPDTPGLRQPLPTVDPVTNMRAASTWAPSMSVAVDGGWPAGAYLFKFVSADGGQSLYPFVVRDDTSHAAVLVQTSVTTYQAYNRWGGASLYSDSQGRGAGRSKVVSFDRPYDGNGATDFVGFEASTIAQMEATGTDVTYTTDVDTHAHPDLAQNHRMFVSGGHDEYWSKEMRDGVEAARDHGTNLVFLGSNAIYRRIRLEPSALGPLRHEVNYRDPKADPLSGKDDARVTAEWRSAPAAKPESSLIGDYYECNPVLADMVIAQADSWVFAGTGLHTGDRLPKLVGSEYDRVQPEAPTPAGIEVLAHSPVVCRNAKSYADMTYYTAPSGAGVLATGTMNLAHALGQPCSDSALGGPDRVTCQIRRLFQNVLDVFATAPAGMVHPSVSNLAALGIHPGYVNPKPPT